MKGGKEGCDKAHWQVASQPEVCSEAATEIRTQQPPLTIAFTLQCRHRRFEQRGSQKKKMLADGHRVKVRNVDVPDFLMRCSTLTFLSALTHMQKKNSCVCVCVSAPNRRALWAQQGEPEFTHCHSVLQTQWQELKSFSLYVIVVVKADILLNTLFLLDC